MKDLKIRVDNDAESREVQELFFELGYKWFSGGKNIQHLEQSCSSGFGYLVAWSTGCFTNVIQCGCGAEDAKEITLPELRDLVVLKRNDVRDATHTDGYYSFYVGKDKNYFFSSCDKAWRDTWKNVDILKPIEKPMKEYLRKNSNGTYSYIRMVQPEHMSDFMIEIPEGATAARLCEDVEFYKNDFGVFFSRTSGNWLNTISPRGVLMKSIVWQRHTHPEELPFIDDEPSINDQYAEIEKVRQSHRTASETADPTIKETLSQRQEQYGSFEDVAMFTEQMVDVMRKGYYEKLAYNQKMALYMICSKMARIVNGNPNHKDSWHDIAGYATLIDNELVSEKDMPF